MVKLSETERATGSVLVVDDDCGVRTSMSLVLRRAGHQVATVASGQEGLNQLCDDDGGLAPDVIVTDLNMPGMSGLQFIAALREKRIDAQVVMVTAHASVDTAVEAMRLGAYDYIEKPFNADQLEDLISRAMQHGRANAGSATPAAAVATADGVDAEMIGNSPAMRQLKQMIAQAAPVDVTVLISGESGSGKELIARAVHRESSRAAQPMVSVNCPALSPQLMESELFGHERGAFTSADAARTGRFELARGGTLLLDEVTEIDLASQAKLLRVLQERRYERVGSSRSIDADVRVIAATNRDLQKEVAAGTFREDLYFRLNVIRLQAPPLRDRREDIPALARHFLNIAATRAGRQLCQLEPAAEQLLLEHRWPGNVRELENVMTQATVLTTGDIIKADGLRNWIIQTSSSREAVAGGEIPVGVSLNEMKRRLIIATLEKYQGHREKTAKALGIGVRTLLNNLRSYGYKPHARVFDS